MSEEPGNAEQVQSQVVPSRPHSMADGSFKDIPEYFEVCILSLAVFSFLTIPLQVELGESIAARTESLCQYHSFPPLVPAKTADDRRFP